MMLPMTRKARAMQTLTATTCPRRGAALMLMLAVSGAALLGCADDRAYRDPSPTTRIDFPFSGFNALGFHGADGREAALAS
jgi:hypothetical protein